MMSEEDRKKILAAIDLKLQEKDVPAKPTGQLKVNLQTGGVSGQVKLELVL